MKIERDDHRQQLTMTADRMVTIADLFDAVDFQHRYGLWHYAALFDLRRVSTNITAGELHALARHAAALDPSSRRGPIAVVATNDALSGIARMYTALTDRSLTIEVFRDLEAAQDWLDQR